LSTLLVLAIKLYRLLISPLFPASCRFTPSCSHYAEEAIRRHGIARGSLLTVRRLLRCHPYHPGGNDPVPLARHESARTR
jgi:putative membrane protein insertion efficiency factor